MHEINPVTKMLLNVTNEFIRKRLGMKDRKDLIRRYFLNFFFICFNKIVSFSYFYFIYSRKEIVHVMI